MTAAIAAPPRPVARFLALHGHLPEGEFAQALARAIGEGGGSWLHPGIGRRPATHEHEIALHGVEARGATFLEAAHNWRLAAMRMVGGRG